METQLKQQYLIDEEHRCGLYLVGWFQSDPTDKRERQCGPSSRTPMTDAKSRLDRQADEISNGVIRIRVFVLDARLPHA